jgi:hypothetical protein
MEAKNLLKAVVLVGLVGSSLVVLGGCTKKEKTAGGIGIGGLAGAGVGAAVGGGPGAAIGAVGGAVVGGLVGSSLGDDKEDEKK